MKTVYVIGPYRAKTIWEIERNIRKAEKYGLRIAEAGAMPVIPHSMTRFFHGTVNEQFWLDGLVDLMAACDAVFTIPGWEKSEGSCVEVKEAEEMQIPRFCTVEDLEEWLKSQPNEDTDFLTFPEAAVNARIKDLTELNRRIIESNGELSDCLKVLQDTIRRMHGAAFGHFRRPGKGQGFPIRKGIVEDVHDLYNRARNAEHERDIRGAEIKNKVTTIDKLRAEIDEQRLIITQLENALKACPNVSAHEVIKRLVQECHNTALEKGWWDCGRQIPELLALIHSDASEALEDFRNRKMSLAIDPVSGKPTGFPSELADILIRIFDMAAPLGIDLGTALDVKMAYNKTRAFRHGNKAA